jgi:hypothetical protein
MLSARNRLQKLVPYLENAIQSPMLVLAPSEQLSSPKVEILMSREDHCRRN